jgi:signal transduction histidine kinase
MMDYTEGLKKEVAEIKFLIHDLRVTWFFNEVIHYHVSLDTDLEIHNVDQAQMLHGADLDELKSKAREVRKHFREYSDAVTNFSPDRTVLLTGERVVQAIFDMCKLVLSPLWGRIDRVLSFLPEESRSVRSRLLYRNCIRWISGVYYRLENFLAEREGKSIHEEFDVAEDIRDFAHNVLYGYVVERSSARVELRIDRLDPAVLGGRRHRFRRMFFNLIMNAVDAMKSRKVGVITISDVVEGDHVILQVSDNGSGMPPAKIEQLLTDKPTLDGELASLGFVFVRQTIAEFGGTLEITSEEGKGTTVTIRLPHLPDATPTAREPSGREKFKLLKKGEQHPPELRARKAAERGKQPASADAADASWGDTILEDYRTSDAPYPGCIFAIGVTDEDEVDYFTHRPYDRLWNITHEDLAPMFFRATVRGRLEEDEDKQLVLILKAPHNAREYFDFKELSEGDRNPEAYVRMVHDEYVRIARKLIASGMEGGVGVHLTEIQKFFADRRELIEKEPFALEALARQKLTDE